MTSFHWRRIIIASLFLGASCGPQYAPDPNARVLVISQYENEPIVIHLPSNSPPQANCVDKTEVACARILFWDADKFILTAENLIKQKLYLSASLEYLQALTRLTEAHIRIKRLEKWTVEEVTLKRLVYKKIKLCKMKINLLHSQRR
ncbi:MAG: hypothetical protein GOVbin630_134 [Prokaryotic dsDNA virus sp.]|nr:MAG: hypothetical protein GOVbin630_134 [Prokaryotic dsDNA virus sp.]|tara:strand:- start:3251 stop:3691 length:441 start_codon:yes stop_codon:yes gene_type:complete